ncbi:MAG: MBOAT family protein [Schwartzia sp.]|nr:MBOAT family protein [Schwartzia sp. (in: firmicutes)]
MLFNSSEFIFLFLPITFLLFFAIAKRGGIKAATFWLTAASFFFYGWWDYRYVPLLFGSICFNYFIGRRIEDSERGKGWLVFGVAGNLVLLGIFKYTGFFLDTVNAAAGAVIFDVPRIVLPLGISFFTFTQTAYLVDIYRRETKNEGFLTYCEFVTIFPHLIAGPIISHKKMMPQFTAAKNFVVDYRNVAMGICLFTMGLFKKAVIADKLSPWVADAFARADSLTFLEAWLGALNYTFQLYFDFSGYSEMAIGLGLMFNLELPMNFNSPYQATSMIDFWRRWHMTLGAWVRDYLYIPMGGNQSGELRKMRNLFVSMLLVGLWHGAGWTFVFWGALHGIFMVINHQWRRTGISLPKVVNWGLTFLCVTIGWVFFRAENFHDGWAMLKAMADAGNIALPMKFEGSMGFLRNWGVAFIHWEQNFVNQIGFLLLAAVLVSLKNPQQWMTKFKANYVWLAGTVAAFIYSVLRMSGFSDFLYFQF